MHRFDIMIDHKFKPWLIEVNHTPSFTTDTPLDRQIKKNAIRDAIKLMNITMDHKNKIKNKKKAELQQRVLTGKKVKLTPEERQANWEQAQKERDIYEAQNCGCYEKIFPIDVKLTKMSNH
jgi:tubulin polyglutamylase TTLL6/13